MNKLTKRCYTRLKGVHPDLVKVMEEAIKESPVPFIITEGLRTPERQAELKAAGASRTLNSRHLTGHAVDVACLLNGKVVWDWPLYDKLAKHVKSVAKKLKIALVAGADWRWRDGPHYELDRNVYKK